MNCERCGKPLSDEDWAMGGGWCKACYLEDIADNKAMVAQAEAEAEAEEHARQCAIAHYADEYHDW